MESSESRPDLLNLACPVLVADSRVCYLRWLFLICAKNMNMRFRLILQSEVCQRKLHLHLPQTAKITGVGFLY